MKKILYTLFTTLICTVTILAQSELTVRTYPKSVRLERGDRMRFTADIVPEGVEADNPLTASKTLDARNEVVWSVSGAASAGTVITADGQLKIAADERSKLLQVTATNRAGVQGVSTVHVIKQRSDGGITFGVISDVHTGVTPVLGSGNNLCLQNAFDFYNGTRAERIVVAGDFGDYGTWDELEVFRRIRDRHAQIPVLASMGNHDANNWEIFERATGSRGNDMSVLNGYYFITVSPGAGTLDEATGRATGRHADRYDYVRDRLRERVDEAKKASGDKPVFVFCHHPLREGIGLENMFDGDPRVVFFSGHIHLPNNSPLGISQDNGFTEVNTAVTGLVAQGLLVEADKKGNITVRTRDFNRNKWVQEWKWNIHKTLPYTNALRAPLAKAPTFAVGATLRVTSVTSGSASVEFNNALIPSPNPAGDIVMAYRGALIKKTTGDTVRRLNIQPSLFSDTVRQTLYGLEASTSYELQIKAFDAWRKESATALVGSFQTTEKEASGNRPTDIVMKFDGNLRNEGEGSPQMYRQAHNPGLYDTVPHFEQGVHGQAIDLSALNFIDLDGSGDALIDYSRSFSVAFWLNIKSVRTDGEAAILSNRNVNRERYNGYTFRTSTIDGVNYIVLEVSPVNGKYAQLKLTPSQTGQWTHIAAVFDYLKNRITAYVNGLPVQDVEADLSGGIGGIVSECPFKNTFFGSAPWNYSNERGGYNGCGKGNNDIRFLADDFIMSSRVFTHEDVGALLEGVGTVTYPAAVRINKGDHLRFVAEAPVTENIKTVKWTVEGATSSKTAIAADGMLTIGADEKAAILTVRATSAGGSAGSSQVTVTSPRTDGKVSFGVITDVHVGGSANMNTGNNKRLVEAFGFYNAPALQADRVVLTGDLSGNGNWLELFIFRMIRNQYLQVPLLAMMGNHEENKWENFERATGNKPSEVNIIDGYYFITVSPGDGALDEATMRSTGESQSRYAYIREWLTARLKEAEAASPDKPIFIFQHHEVDSKHDLFETLRNHPRAIIFSGDTHDVNNHPLSIRQEGNFTWVHCGAVCSEAEFNYTSEGIYVEADATGNVTIKTRDFTNNRWLDDQIWSFNVNKPLPYTAEKRLKNAQTPVFAADAKIRITDLRVKSVVAEFDRPTIPANSVNDIVYKYHYQLIKKSNGKMVKDLTEWADFCLYPKTKTKSIELNGLEKATAYTLRVYGIDAWGKQSKALTCSFVTASIDTVPRKPIDYALHFDGTLQNAGKSPAAVKMFYLDSKPNVYDTIPHFAEGRHGQAIELNKRNFITLDNNADLIDYDQSFTVAMWLKITMVRNDGGPGVLSNRNVDGQAFKGYAFRTGNNGGVNSLYLEITPVNADYQKYWIAPTRLNEWMHVATTFDYEHNSVTFYVDGVKTQTVTVDLSGGVGGITGLGRNKATFLGSTPWNYTEEHGGYNGGGTAGRNDIRFLADDFIMLNRILSAAEIAELAK